MNLHHIEASYKQLTDVLKRRWRKMVDQQLELFSGNRRRAQPIDKKAAQQQVPPPK